MLPVVCEPPAGPAWPDQHQETGHFSALIGPLKAENSYGMSGPHAAL